MIWSIDQAGSSISVRAYPEELTLRGGDDRSAARAAAEAEGQRWLANKKADVLIWGEVGKADQVLRLRIPSKTSPTSTEAKGYRLNRELELPAGFGNELGDALEGLVLASIAPAYGGAYVADVLDRTLTRLRALAQNLPPAFSKSNYAAVLSSFATAAFCIGGQRGDNASLEAAIAAGRDALAALSRKKDPDEWAATQNGLGIALSALGKRESGTVRLEEAVAAYSAARRSTSGRGSLSQIGTTLPKAISKKLKLLSREGGLDDSVLSELGFVSEGPPKGCGSCHYLSMPASEPSELQASAPFRPPSKSDALT
jgi:hypothetical protein